MAQELSEGSPVKGVRCADENLEVDGRSHFGTSVFIAPGLNKIRLGRC